ncbi:hypothetical protein CMO89_02240 [Candidatus Woesearchaeota archaeon]|jgi:hypothetical protein|nr:hypothetical protein [Candidatus Woesearchaeota archaeon]|tara:strand:- start:1548 stop:1742 length:195 start_codon:yes stop_codon:yes gene_type:complete
MEDDKKKKGVSVHATIPMEQFKAIKKLEGTLGTGVNGVVANIVHNWLYQQDWFHEIVKEKLKKK